jgi:FMN phosphatase YigB (HAD superfamily)
MNIATGNVVNHSINKDSIQVNELITVLDHYPKVTVLSLDCFDTLLWRNTAASTDVWYDTQNAATFQSLKITPVHRACAEALARQMQFVKQGNMEVTLHDIYRSGFKSLTDKQIDLLIEEEITTEINTCFAFPPIVDLMRQAQQKNIKIIITSNTYFDKKQLRRLLQSKLPDDLMKYISYIFCSSDLSLSKGSGLYKHIINKLSITAQSMLHIGDNKEADKDIPQALGINALHLLLNDNKLLELQRMHNTAALISTHGPREKHSLANPFNGIFSCSETNINQAENMLGYYSLGPIMYAFARFILDDVEKLQQEGKRPHVLFLMRDGHLPALACNALAGKTIGKCARISRFTAIASTFRCKEDVELFLAEYIAALPFSYICRQLLLPTHIADEFIRIANAEKFSSYALCKLILQDHILQEIFHQSTEFKNRLQCYLREEMQIQAGETVIFVDIGYLGSAQQALTPIFKEEFKTTDLLGRYIMTLNLFGWQTSRKGLIDPSWCEDKVITLLSSDISLLEEFCSSGDNSVINYSNDGYPLFAKSEIDPIQLEKIRLVQNACLQFISDAKDFFERTKTSVPIDNLKEYALAELTRLLYLPTEQEITFLQCFHHDKNKGFQETYQIYDKASKELLSLQQHGLLFKNQHPHVLRSANIELSLALMIQRRFGTEINLDDRSFRKEWIKIIIMQDQKPVQRTCNAMLTYDGYFALCLPIAADYTQLAILFGFHYQLLELKSAEIISAHAFLTENEAKNSENILPNVVFNQVMSHGDNVIECQSNNSAMIMMFKPQHLNNILRIVFRPIQIH